jgi:hypothetical protein
MAREAPEMMDVSAQASRINVAIAIWQWAAISTRPKS